MKSVVPSTKIDFFPHSLQSVQRQEPLLDQDALSPATTYVLLPGQRLEIGKYVPDPTQGKDISNPKHKQQDSSVHEAEDLSPPRPTTCSARTGRKRPTTASMIPPLTAAASEEQSVMEGDEQSDGEQDNDPPTAAESAPSSNSSLITYQVVKGAVAGGVFFPIYDGPLSVKDRNDPRGTPKSINLHFHGSDRASVSSLTLGVKSINANKLVLFKIGPGAVAFRVVVNAFEAGGLQYTPSNRLFNVLWAKRATPAILKSLSPYQKINHFPGAWGIGRKDSLAMNMTKMKRQFGGAAFDVVPSSFVLPRDKDDLADDVRAATQCGETPTYIVKPSASSCGRGIKLFQGMPPIPKAGNKTFVCQRYVGNPFLVNERKFDLRMYCVATGFDPLKLYLFDEGLVRFAAEKYPGPDKGLENVYMHLTNYSVSKTAELSKASRGKSEESDDPIDIKWCISDFKQWLVTNHGEKEGRAMWTKIQTSVHDVVVKTFLSIEAEVVARVRAECSDPTGRNCFELYGLDLMIDDNLKVYLIEVNIMPSLATGSTLDKAVKSRMLAHMLTLARIVPVSRSTLQEAVASSGSNLTTATAPLPRGPYVPGGDRYYFNGVRGCLRGPIERTNLPLFTSFNSSTQKESTLTAEETLMLLELEEEHRCAGGFRRIFPAAGTSAAYFPYFTGGVSRNNFLAGSWAEMQEKVSK